jgi:hypothetical protein
MSVLCGINRNMLGYVEKDAEAVDVWAHQDSNLGPSDYESDALTN